MKTLDYIILALVVLCLASAIIYIRRSKKKGKGCCGDCSKCSGCK